jgi:GNAT superfamily N-acetyltransferase
MIEVLPYADDADEQLGLDVYNAVWPQDRIGIPEERSFRASLRDYVDLLARLDGDVVGTAVGAIQPHQPELVFALVSVLPERRRRGAGTALYSAASAWARERGLDTIETIVADDDGESLTFAQRRGFVEHSHEKGVSLDLTRIEPPTVAPPEGVEIATWAERPELARGIYEVALEAEPDIPGAEDMLPEPFEDWLAHDMQGPGDRAEATSVKRAWRGRGVARALKATQIAWAKANGYEELRTRNEERNAPIRRLNEEFGYRPTIGRIYLKGPLA